MKENIANFLMTRKRWVVKRSTGYLLSQYEKMMRNKYGLTTLSSGDQPSFLIED
jgi:hypothetical protein